MAASNMRDLYIIRKEAGTTLIDNIDLIAMNLNTGTFITRNILLGYDDYYESVPYQIVKDTFKCLQDDIQGVYILFTCQRRTASTPSDGRYYTYLLNVTNGTTRVLDYLETFGLYNKTCFIAYDINGLVFIYIRETNTLLTFTIYPGEAYVDWQARLLSQTDYQVESMFSTSYNGIVYYTQKSTSSNNRYMSSYNLRIMDYENSRVNHLSLYTENYRIRFVDCNNSNGDRELDVLHYHDNPAIAVDYAGTQYYCSLNSNNSNMIDVYYEPANDAAYRLLDDPIPRAIPDTSYVLDSAFTDSLYCVGGKDANNVDLGDKVIFYNLITTSDNFRIIGLLVDIGGNDEEEYSYIYPNPDTEPQYLSLDGIPGICVKILPFNHLTNRYVIQPVVYIKHKQPFYDIDDVLKVKYIVDVPSDRTRIVNIKATLRRGATMIFTDEFQITDPNPYTEREHNFEENPDPAIVTRTYNTAAGILGFVKEVGIYTVRMTAIINIDPNEPDIMVIGPIE